LTQPGPTSLSGKIAVIGWGSLIWDLDDLAPKVAGDWVMEGGPSLPLEFSRVSPKRAMSLVVVVDPDDGAPCPSHVNASVRDDIHAAAHDLQRRERAQTVAQIGAVCRRTGFSRATDTRIAEIVLAWCEAHDVAGAVWTDLPRNFAEITGKPFGIPAGMAYLRELPEHALAEAVRYITLAPVQTATPLRAALEREDWWREARRRLLGADGG
jgi:hypothetical protein